MYARDRDALVPAQHPVFLSLQGPGQCPLSSSLPPLVHGVQQESRTWTGRERMTASCRDHTFTLGTQLILVIRALTTAIQLVGSSPEGNYKIFIQKTAKNFNSRILGDFWLPRPCNCEASHPCFHEWNVLECGSASCVGADSCLGSGQTG